MVEVPVLSTVERRIDQSTEVGQAQLPVEQAVGVLVSVTQQAAVAGGVAVPMVLCLFCIWLVRWVVIGWSGALGEAWWQW